MTDATQSIPGTEDQEVTRDWNDETTRTAAERFAERVISTMFKPEAAERHLSRTDVMALAIVAFEKGAEWESRR